MCYQHEVYYGGNFNREKCWNCRHPGLGSTCSLPVGVPDPQATLELKKLEPSHYPRLTSKGQSILAPRSEGDADPRSPPHGHKG